MFKTSVRSTSVQITASHDFVPQSPTYEEELGWPAVRRTHASFDSPAISKPGAFSS